MQIKDTQGYRIIKTNYRLNKEDMMVRRPFQTSDCGKYWDYNFKILGICFNVSVEKLTGRLFILKDENKNN
jgi:hypothetical protein